MLKKQKTVLSAMCKRKFFHKKWNWLTLIGWAFADVTYYLYMTSVSILSGEWKEITGACYSVTTRLEEVD